MHHNTKKLVGKRFGKLTVIKLAKERLSDNRITWTCKCDCGKEIDRTSVYLNDNRTATHSCGCVLGLKRRIKVEPGTIRGKLTVISDAPDKVTPNGDKHSMLRCICTCGKEIEIYNAGFRKNRYLSCGGSVCKRHISDKDMIINKKFQDYKYGAKKRKYDFKLTKKNFEVLLFNNCYYCGCEPINIYKPKDGHDYYYNGIDRVNNTAGYELNNVVTCCGKCNIMKNDNNKDEFINHLRKIVGNIDEKE